MYGLLSLQIKHIEHQVIDEKENRDRRWNET